LLKDSAILDEAFGFGGDQEDVKDGDEDFVPEVEDAQPRSKGTSDTITVENGLTKPQKWLMEWLRAGVKDEDPHMASLEDMEKNFRRANKEACNGKLSPDPLIRGWMAMKRRIDRWRC
jgi:hypothetical protein